MASKQQIVNYIALLMLEHRIYAPRVPKMNISQAHMCSIPFAYQATPAHTFSLAAKLMWQNAFCGVLLYSCITNIQPEPL